MLAYRIVHHRYSSLQASGLEGRWNSAGNRVVYAAESIGLAFLESMIRRQGVGFNSDFRIMIIDLPGNSLTEITAQQLKKGWRKLKEYEQCQKLGDEWYRSGQTLLLKVPSAVLPQSCNYVIHTAHPRFGDVKLLEVCNLLPDERIEQILKKYPG